MRTILSFIVFIVSASASGAHTLLDVDHKVDSRKAEFEFFFDKELSDKDIMVNFLRRTVEWEIKDTKLQKDKKFVKVNRKNIKNIYISQKEEQVLRFRINFNEHIKASSLHKQVSFEKNGKVLRVYFDRTLAPVREPLEELSRVYDIEVYKEPSKLISHFKSQSSVEADEDSVNSKGKINNSSESTPLDVVGGEESVANKSESEIPLNLAKKEKAAASNNFGFKFIVSLAVILVLCVSVFLVNKKLKAKETNSTFNSDSIKIVSQKYIGPKRNLTIIRAAGEYILLGVTDSNINLIKTLSIIEDEIQDLEPKSFGSAMSSFLKREQKEEQVALKPKEKMPEIHEDRFTISSIEDVKKLMSEEAS